MDSKFEEAAYKLEAGQVSDPIKSSHGYHIIKLTEKKRVKNLLIKKKIIFVRNWNRSVHKINNGNNNSLKIYSRKQI